MLDGAWGVLIQAAGSPRRPTAASASRPPARRRGRPRPAQPDAARDRRSSIHDALLRGRRRHRDDEHLHGDVDRPGATTGSRTHVVRDEPSRARGSRAQARGRTAAGFVAGSVGPLNVTLSLSPKVDDAALPGGDVRRRSRDAYAEQIGGAARGRRRPPADRDDLRHAEREGGDRRGARRRARAAAAGSRSRSIDRSGRNLSGQTVEAFWTSVEHAEPLIVGVNCSLGAREMRPYVEELARVADTYVSCHPNAGLPNAFGRARRAARATRAATSASSRESGLVNVVGGCCGTTPEHVAAIAAAVEGVRRGCSRRSRRTRASAASSRSRSGPTPAS